MKLEIAEITDKAAVKRNENKVIKGYSMLNTTFQRMARNFCFGFNI
jgi:hypothetical protein